MERQKKNCEPMINTCIRLNKKTLEMLEDIADRKKRKTSELMRLVLENYVEQVEN